MIVKRYCGHERLPGGERRWRRLARAAGFSGSVELYGYGVAGKPGREQRAAMRTGVESGVVVADYGDNIIRVWLTCRCAAAEFDTDRLAYEQKDPLTNFAHELGHHVVKARGRKMLPWVEEAVAERYGRRLLRRIA